MKNSSSDKETGGLLHDDEEIAVDVEAPDNYKVAPQELELVSSMSDHVKTQCGPFEGQKEHVQGLKAWIRIDASGNSQVIEADKFTVMSRCDLPARDLRLLDPLFDYPTTILGRDKAIVLNLEQIRCIITADEVLLLNSLDSYVLQYVVELQRRLQAAGTGEVRQKSIKRRGRRFGNRASSDFPLEFKALEVALESVCAFLDSQVTELEIKIYPLLDELTSKTSTLNLERVRRSKRELVALTRRVEKVRDEIEQLMDDDDDMDAMCLTERKRRAASFDGKQSGEDQSNDDTAELQMLLEANFVLIDGSRNKLTSLKEYIEDTEEFISIQLDSVRNQLIRFDLLLSTSSFVIAIFGLVAGVFGTNLRIPMYNDPGALKWIMIVTGVSGALIFASFWGYFKYRRLLPQ